MLPLFPNYGDSNRPPKEGFDTADSLRSREGRKGNGSLASP